MTVDDRVSVLALVEGESWVRGATVVHRDQTVLHIDADEPLPLAVGSVVGLLSHGVRAEDAPTGAVASGVTLAMVAESVGPTVAALRIIERRS